MSRYYRLFVIAVGITEEQLLKVFSEFGWDGQTFSWKDMAAFDGEGYLCGGMSEEEAHDEIYDALKKINTEAKIKTQWTYLEDLPYEEYGDEID